MSRSPVLALVLLAGCSYPEFEFVDSGVAADSSVAADTNFATDSSEPPDTTEPIDTGSEPVDSSIADTGAPDTATPDTAMTDSAVVDTSIDSADTATDTGPVGCTAGSPGVFFCQDFNMSAIARDGWSGYSLSSGSEQLLETTGAYSPPKLLLAKTPASPTATEFALVNTMVLPDTIDRGVRIDVWIKLDTTFAGNRIYLFKYLRGGAGDGLAFSLDPTGFFLEVGAPGGGNRRISTPVPIGRWFHVRMDAKLLITGGSATVWIDDMTTAALTYSGRTIEIDSTDRRLSVGLYVQNGTAPYAARFDDVSIAWR